MSEPYLIVEAVGKPVPIVVSVPHCGLDFPEELRPQYKPEMAAQPDDTDWFVHRLYDFISELGITMIHARYSRWVIDLNRDPESKPLYNDGRIITALTPSTDFFGKDIYTEPKFIPGEEETQRRLQNYFWPYYRKIEDILAQRKAAFGKALLWDAHSIRHFVPTIRKEAFPDLIMGDNDEKTAHPELIRTALATLGKSNFSLTHNTPFKGGHITRYFGEPGNNIHALQLEMSKLLYMDDTELSYHEKRAEQVRKILKNTIRALIEKMETI